MNYTSYNVFIFTKHIMALGHWPISVLMIDAAGFLKDSARQIQMCDNIKIRLAESLYCHRLTYLYPPVLQSWWGRLEPQKNERGTKIMACAPSILGCGPDVYQPHHTSTKITRGLLSISRHMWCIHWIAWKWHMVYTLQILCFKRLLGIPSTEL